ncbi:MAG: RNA polymerase sigma-70 factor (ECF subfamily) [Myxococcota bacterium]|jgi:RNA polymerase sigma-70 factor (ECF subfamily)
MRIDVEAAYRQYGDMVLGRCRSLLGSDADAREAMQEVFIKLIRYRDRFRGDSSLSTFIYRITTNHCLNQIRSKKRRPEDPTEDLSFIMTPTVSLMDRIEVRQIVDQLLDGQDERTQECVVYHYMDGMTHKEVGALLGISGAAVRKRIAKFRHSVADQQPAWLTSAS